MQLHTETVTPLLMNALIRLMNEPLFKPFRLVGGTNLSLRLGHRKSVDLDLFTDCQYGSLDFGLFEKFLENAFPYFDCPDRSAVVSFGKSYYVGLSADECFKLDLMYTDTFFDKAESIEGIRMASTEQIAAMKMEALNNGGRKKDWWDVHELLTMFSLKQLMDLHKKWQPWTHDPGKLLEKLVDFDEADTQPDPVCLKGKLWDFIKMDMIDAVSELNA